MLKIKKLADRIIDEVDDAEYYAHKYTEEKACGNNAWAMKYREMAHDELKHSRYLHEMASQEVKKAEMKATEEMQERWEAVHKHYIEKYATVKQILSM